uniref:fumarate reductase (NADH) n=1 Tax=Mucochytrium quahogii TaxID=96639 RepID=A0A7S2W7A0_9STRA|mmetsp:Transcript_26381/g.42729  ORF Transcript_26381/g.42729 Transcript_26381/m.42729 type:complete len:1086 (-) Transcript_26381:4478-7735(-)|eukprot:CAMPEP_0203757550 /NCGR_PEP_ID=MMETSP0098-20131031/10562_1 /ASSEMBLY_ACC=CAM_ASM_000208 /TAXON_ID=96639 /ORGANISM=" , Strain NY0313808BC1" /LENGTH=1085 /DNA_ID=CAMNT_0050649769 /DNA_START=556 /DNA_END=3813 /DNA_ORIENTATION=+
MRASIMFCVAALGVLASDPVCASSDFSFIHKDIKCTEREIQRANHELFSKVLSELMRTTYFRLFRVQLDGECPLEKPEEKKEDPGCAPPPDIFSPNGGGFGAASAPAPEPLCSLNLDGADALVDKTLSKAEDSAVSLSEEECDDENLPTFWLNLCAKLPFHDGKKDYINLQLNPEQFTGYNGSDIWAAVYSENCFDNSEENMCYEERFLYRLLSGLHSSINLHISENYYPPRKGKRETWEPNLERFKKQFVGQESRFKNLEFAFVVLLRALRKATPTFKELAFDAGDLDEALRTQKLVNILLDSHVLSSCEEVFEAFDETLLFEDKESHQPSTMSNLKRKFKGIFHNISSTFHCVKCQKCRLHGKLQLLGIGTALKILLLPPELLRDNIAREEVVALFNTIGKLSEAIEIYTRFNNLSVEMANKDINIDNFPPNDIPEIVLSSPVADVVEAGLAAVSKGVQKKTLSEEEEDALVDALLDNDKDVMLLGKHFALNKQFDSFIRHSTRRLNLEKRGLIPDVIIVGAGLAGLAAAVTILDRGGSVVLVDKEGVAGGNSAKASSGINAIDLSSKMMYDDSVERFKADTLKGSGKLGDEKHELVDILTEGSPDALEWLRTRANMSLYERGQLGGHSRGRTWRPAAGLAGSEMIAAITKVLKPFTKDESRCRFLKKTQALKLVLNGDGTFSGVELQDLKTKNTFTVNAKAVIIATGGYAYHNVPHPLLEEVRPDLTPFATTNGRFATGDGIRMATAIGGDTIELDHVQVHPTGFVDPADPSNPVKTLAAEILRGVGGVLLDDAGERFANELGTRKYLSEAMMHHAEAKAGEQPKFLLLLNEEAASKAPKHIPMYVAKGLIKKYDTIKDLAEGNNLDIEAVQRTVVEFGKSLRDPQAHPDHFNRTVFPGTGFEQGPYYAGFVTPVLHYCMGGLKINGDTQILNRNGVPVGGGTVYAIGETVGGIHGENRLGGNALTECVVFGRHIGETLPLQGAENQEKKVATESAKKTADSGAEDSERKISMEELSKHNSAQDCWISISGKVYDFTDFVEDHPGGAEALTKLAGLDGTEEFFAIHSESLLEDYDPVGQLVT